jgi:hypothetical protein
MFTDQTSRHSLSICLKFARLRTDLGTFDFWVLIHVFKSLCEMRTSLIVHLDHHVRSARMFPAFIPKVLASSFGWFEDFLGFSHAKCWTLPWNKPVPLPIHNFHFTFYLHPLNSFEASSFLQRTATPWSRFFIDKLIAVHLVKHPAFSAAVIRNSSRGSCRDPE